MPVAVIDIIVDENRRFPWVEGPDIGKKNGEIPVMGPDPSMGYRELQREECNRIQEDHSGYDRPIGLASISLPEFVPDNDKGKRCEDEKSRQEDENIPRVLYGEENEKIKHHDRNDPEREKKHLRRIQRFQFSPSHQRIYRQAEWKQAGAESENNELDQLKEKTDEGIPFPSQQRMSPGIEHPQLTKRPPVGVPPAAHPQQGDEPEQARDRQHTKGSDYSPEGEIPHGIQP